MTSSPFYQGVLKRLAAVAVAIGTTDAAAAADALGSIPLDVAEKLVGARELDEWDEHDRIRLLSLMARDLRPSVRARVAERLTATRTKSLDDDTEALLDRLAIDPDVRVRVAVQQTLDRMLPRLTGLERSSLLGRWATSPHAQKRLLVARLLQQRHPVLWADGILEYLSRDESVSVRAAARSAAEARGIELPEA